MRKRILVLATGLLLSLPGSVKGLAQMPPPMMGGGSNPIDVRKFNADKELTRLSRKYKLSEDQKGKIRPILEEQQKKVHALGEDESLSDDEWVSAVRKTHRQTVLAVKEQMTDVQASKYMVDEEKQAKDDAEADLERRMMPDGPSPGGPPPGGGGPPM